MSINKKVLFEHFHGRSTPLEKQLIEEWLQNDENIELYFECLDEWERENLQFYANDGSAFQKTFESINEEADTAISIHQKSIYQLLYSKISVAVVFIFIVSGIIYFNKDNIFNKTVRTNYGEITSFLLPDGSRVSLNSNSTLQYPRFGFGVKSREVLLSGEADFSIQHTSNNQKFLVKTSGNLTVTVLGTQFTVYDRHQISKVILKKGKVELGFTENKIAKKIIMQPGDLYTDERDVRTIKHISNTEILSTWKYHIFSFESTSMVEVAKIIKDSFGMNVHFETPSMSESKITGSLKAENAKELIGAISELLGIHYTIDGNNIHLFR